MPGLARLGSVVRVVAWAQQRKIESARICTDRGPAENLRPFESMPIRRRAILDDFAPAPTTPIKTAYIDRDYWSRNA